MARTIRRSGSHPVIHSSRRRKLRGGEIDFETCDQISENEHLEVIARSKPEFGDTLFAHIGASLGEAAFVNTTREFSIKNVALFKPNPAVNDARYLYYLVISPAFQALAKGTKTGSAQPFLGLSQLRGHRIQYHRDLFTQRRIGDILSAYDELIENNERRIKILEEMARSLYREWFVNFRFPGHEKVPLVASPLGDIPQGWEVKTLGKVATITMGLSPKGNTYNEEGDGTPLVNGPVEFGERLTKQVKWTTAPTKFCKESDLVVCVRGSTTGRYVKSDGVYCLGRGVCGISSKYQSFVDLLFENELPTLLGQTSGSTFPSWTGPQLQAYPVLSPPPELLARFEVFVNPMSAAVLGYSRKIQNLRRTRDLLLPRLFSGQISLEPLG